MGGRTEIRRFIKSLSSEFSFIVAGLGRCGTTLVYKSIIGTDKAVRGKFITRFSRQKKYIKGTIYKTHDFPPESLPPHVKLVFMFGNPMNAALSGYEEFKQDKHYRNISSDKFHQRENIFNEDILNLEKHFNAWNKIQGFEFISIRYEALYKEKTQDMLEEYLGFNINLPPYRRRKTDWQSHPMKEALERTYSHLNLKIEAAEDCKIWR
jgi:hypothetical protein